jgi:hypothetical protein
MQDDEKSLDRDESPGYLEEELDGLAKKWANGGHSSPRNRSFGLNSVMDPAAAKSGRPAVPPLNDSRRLQNLCLQQYRRSSSGTGGLRRSPVLLRRRGC